MKSHFDTEIQSILKKDINARKILVYQGNQTFFDKIEEISPIIFNKIDWTTKGYIYFENLENLDENEKMVQIATFFDAVLTKFPELRNEIVIVLGDDLLDCAYEMEFKKFIEVFKHFLEIPQHNYILFKNKMKVINLTFEDELYFG